MTVIETVWVKISVPTVVANVTVCSPMSSAAGVHVNRYPSKENSDDVVKTGEMDSSDT